jgi:hypothetical protein
MRRAIEKNFARVKGSVARREKVSLGFSCAMGSEILRLGFKSRIINGRLRLTRVGLETPRAELGISRTRLVNSSS